MAASLRNRILSSEEQLRLMTFIATGIFPSDLYGSHQLSSAITYLVPSTVICTVSNYGNFLRRKSLVTPECWLFAGEIYSVKGPTCVCLVYFTRAAPVNKPPRAHFEP